MAKQEVSPTKLVEDHKPKYVKFKYIFKDDSLLEELLKERFDMTTLDTIMNDDLVNAALLADFKEYERDIVGKAKDPTFLDDGIIISKHLITKADKKLLKVYIGFFTYNESRYVAVKFEYERFVIVEVFNLI